MYKILVVEDDYNLRSNISELLSTEGYFVEHADNGISGLEKAKKTLPDLIISDIMMPKMDGFELLEELLQNPVTAAIPLIFLSAKTENENLRRGMKLGADDYLFKPFHIVDLLNAVDTRLKKKEIYNSKLKKIQEKISTKIPHELRTPLIPILGFSELIEDEEDVNQIKDMVKIIRSSAEKLHTKIEKLLLHNDLIVKEKENLELIKKDEIIVLSEKIFSSYIGELDNNLKSKERVKIETETFQVKMNEYYLRTCVKELVENALKYSDEKSEVILKTIKDQNNFRIIISDNGRGMTENEIKSIKAFEKFGKNQFTENGIGLGLSLVKKIVELFKGTLSIKSESGKYTICNLTFPLR